MVNARQSVSFVFYAHSPPDVLLLPPLAGALGQDLLGVPGGV